MSLRPTPWPMLLAASATFALIGCGQEPLVFRAKAPPGPWCAANERVRVGERVTGKVAWGQDKWEHFWVDDAGKEYYPPKVADQVWSYLERTGDAKRIAEDFRKDAVATLMTVVAIKPLVVVLDSHLEPSWLKQNRTFFYPEKYYWLAQVRWEGDPAYRDGLQWFSPELKQKPTDLAFSDAGVAEITLPKGKITLTRDGDKCKTGRE